MRSAASGLVAIGIIVLVLGGCALLVGPPAADFDVDPVVVYAGDRVDLDGSPSDGDIVDYNWDVDGVVEHGRMLTTTFARPGIYTVRLTVEDGQGRTDRTDKEITVYARSGTRLFLEEFSDGDVALGRWPLDPTWAVQGDSRIESISGGPGYVLYVNSARETLHRRATRLDLPPLRIGQRLVFSVRAMPLHTQDQHAFVIAPGRSGMDLQPVGLPYYVFSSTYGGSVIREPSAAGTEVGHPVSFVPPVYEWHTYMFSYATGKYVFSVDGVARQTGTMDADPSRGGTTWLLLGDESLTEACQVYYDEIVVSVEE
jgi:PKD repeat protein